MVMVVVLEPATCDGLTFVIPDETTEKAPVRVAVPPSVFFTLMLYAPGVAAAPPVTLVPVIVPVNVVDVAYASVVTMAAPVVAFVTVAVAPEANVPVTVNDAVCWLCPTVGIEIAVAVGSALTVKTPLAADAVPLSSVSVALPEPGVAAVVEEKLAVPDVALVSVTLENVTPDTVVAKLTAPPSKAKPEPVKIKEPEAPAPKASGATIFTVSVLVIALKAAEMVTFVAVVAGNAVVVAITPIAE
jgi:hypothetical protein